MNYVENYKYWCFRGWDIIATERRVLEGMIEIEARNTVRQDNCSMNHKQNRFQAPLRVVEEEKEETEARGEREQ